jgi:GNAT superfamily N-acetyltransferase
MTMSRSRARDLVPVEDVTVIEDFTITVAGPEHYRYAQEICTLIEEAARARGTGIAKREPEYVRRKMEEGKAVIALGGDQLAGFCYTETWSHGKYVANSGLIVAPNFRKMGLAKQIKRHIFELSRRAYPDAKIFGITTSLAVMKINSELGYKPVTFSELTTDDVFWRGCGSCPNYDVLTRTNRTMCLCTGMLYDPDEEATKKRDRPDKHP